MKNLIKPFLFLWPGSTGALRHGLWKHLGVAVFFGIICQLAIFLNFYWIDFLSSFARFCVVGGVVTSWLFLSAAASSDLKRYEKMLDVDSSGEAFLEAQTQYLCGNWFETECCLKNLLKKNPYDVEAILLKATLYRHLRRFAEARKTLAELEKIDASLYWREEIDLEKRNIVEDENEPDDVDDGAVESEKSKTPQESVACGEE